MIDSLYSAVSFCLIYFFFFFFLGGGCVPPFLSLWQLKADLQSGDLPRGHKEQRRDLSSQPLGAEAAEKCPSLRPVRRRYLLLPAGPTVVVMAPIEMLKMAVDYQHQNTVSNAKGLGISNVSHAQFAPGTKLDKNNHLRNPPCLQTQLQFNRNVPAHPSNLAIRYSTPGPIIIEKLTQSHSQSNIQQKDDDVQSSRSSLSFSVVSEDKLNLAVQMAKRDIKRKHLEEKLKQDVAKKSQEKSSKFSISKETAHKRPGNIADRNKSRSQVHFKNRQQLPSEVTDSGAKVYVYTPNDGVLHPAFSDSPPTHDPGPGPKMSPQKESDRSVREVRRLQKELSRYIQKIEELAKKERSVEVLDPDEERRDRIRQQEQNIRSARILYVLQQQVKEIQADLEKLSPHKIKHTKKTEQQIPAHYKELGQLIRQLSLCSAKLDKEADSCLSDTIISILQQVENLDSLLEKKQTPKKMKKLVSKVPNRSPPARELFPVRQQSVSPRRGKKAPVLKEQEPPAHTGLEVTERPLTEQTKHSAITRNIGSHLDKDQLSKHGDSITIPSRNAIPKADGESLAEAGILKGDAQPESEPLKNKGVLLPERPQGFRQVRKLRPRQSTVKSARFQDTTVSFRLKENRPPTKENKTPWVPTNPTSTPASPRRVIWGKAKVSPSKPFGKGDASRDQAALPRDSKEERQLTGAEKEAIRLAWLDSETARRMDQLNKLHREEMDSKYKLRSDLSSPARVTPQNQLRTHRDNEQVTANTDVVSEMPSNDVLEDTARELWNMERFKKLNNEAIAFQYSPNLEMMIQRLEEMERYQESVRRRVNQIVYAGPEFWVNEEKERENAPIDKRPVSPHPIRIIKTVEHKDPEVSIVLEKPLEGAVLSGAVELEEELENRYDLPRPLPLEMAWQNKGCTFLSIPKQMMQSVRDYNDRYGRHLRLTSHEAIGGFNPWHITESLAEDLLEGALCDVAAELQDVCEDYAEAVFTSEFLQPTM
uniref:Protein moonraker isoform X2 n=1 Tax=Geotrypetes seraphini TaxID=260995 RepID=A0A6P8PAG1_GEOSA|nr:protein moonraker isoform X2 [Geotrypetes seraphini]